MQNTFEKVKEIIVDQLCVNEDEVTMEANLIEDLGADSLTITELVMEFEEKLNIEIPDNALESIKTVGDIVKFIDNNN